MSIKSKAASVTFDAVTKIYTGTVKAVEEVSFNIEAGSLVTLLGPSGCGKTTTLRMIAGLEMATSGRISIGDQDVTKLPATDRDVSMVFQSYALFPHMTVGENVAYGLKVSGASKPDAIAQALDGLKLVGLEGFQDRLPSELSGGQQQRVAVARALVLEPQVLLFDEPLSNLDAKLRRKVREEIRDIQLNLGLTSVYVTHDQTEALAVSDRIIVMKNAKIAQEGSPRELYEEPADRFVSDFIGDANIVNASILSIEGDHAQVQIGSIRQTLPSRGLKSGDVQVAIRPEVIRISADRLENSLEAQILKATYLGSHMEYVLASDLGEFFVIDADVGKSIQKGMSVSLQFGDHGLSLIKP